MSVLMYGYTTKDYAVDILLLLQMFKETFGIKAKCKLHEGAACCFEQILEAAPHKTAIVWLLASHLIKHQSKVSKTCWALMKKS